MGTPHVGRRDLRRALVLNATTKPGNVLVGAGVAAAGLLLAVVWLVPVAVAFWLVLSVQTFLDEHEAERVGELLRATHRAPAAPEPTALAQPLTFAPDIAERVRAARAARVSIRRAAAESPLGLDDVTHEVDALVLGVQAHAVRAQRIREFLAERSPDDVRERVQRRLTRLLEEMDHVVTALRTVEAEILVADGLDQGALAGQVSELRDQVQAASAGLEAAFADDEHQLRG